MAMPYCRACAIAEGESATRYLTPRFMVIITGMGFSSTSGTNLVKHRTRPSTVSTNVNTPSPSPQSQGPRFASVQAMGVVVGVGGDVGGDGCCTLPFLCAAIDGVSKQPGSQPCRARAPTDLSISLLQVS
mmetsp:Transcript_2653/g.4586  ORF Transcript_2653/g.4586 Transcript_2653/m.4586 type:complete len:130 (+) Transcript_2653:1642-2031(+)